MKYIAVNNQQELFFNQTTIPVIKGHQCLIKTEAIGINRADILQKQGKYPPPPGESLVLGLEISGVITQCGDEVSNWQVGDRIFGLVAGGGYAEYVAINAKHIMPLPKSLSFAQGAAIAEVFLTAFQSLFSLADLKPKQSVLIHAGASGVGTAAIQLARQVDCNIAVTVSSEQKGQACLQLGADHFINHTTTDFVEWAKTHQPNGFNVIIDVVSGEYLPRNIDVASIDSSIIILSMLGGNYANNINIVKLLMKRIHIIGTTLRSRSDEYKDELIINFVTKFWQDLEQGTIKPIINKIYPWSEVEQAHQMMEANLNIGKIILTITD